MLFRGGEGDHAAKAKSREEGAEADLSDAKLIQKVCHLLVCPRREVIERLTKLVQFFDSSDYLFDAEKELVEMLHKSKPNPAEAVGEP